MSTFIYVYVHAYLHMYVCRHIFTYVYVKGLRMKAALSTELSDSSKGRADQTSSHVRSTVSSCPTLSPLPQKHLLPRSDPGSHGSGMPGQQEPVASSSSSALRGAGPSTQETGCYWSNNTNPHDVLYLSILKTTWPGATMGLACPTGDTRAMWRS